MERLVRIYISILLISSCQISNISQIEKKCTLICEINNHTMNYSISLNGNFLIEPENSQISIDLKSKIIKSINLNRKYIKDIYFDFHAIQKNEFQYQVFALTYLTNKSFDILRKDTVEYLFKKIFLIDSNFINTERGVFEHDQSYYDYVRFNLFNEDKIHSFTFFAPKGISNMTSIFNEGISQLITFRSNKVKINENKAVNHNDTSGFNKFNYYLKIANLKEKLASSKQNENGTLSDMANTLLSYYYSFLDNDDSAKYYNEIRYMQIVDTISYRNKCDKSIINDIKPIIFNDFFTIDEIKESRLIILNEAHHLNIHRDIGILFLKKLKQNGFNYFAVEGLINDSSKKLFQNPSYRSGYYVQSRNYFDLIKEANKLGLKIISYEDNFENNNWQIREKNQASNLFYKTYFNDTLAKVFVYCGYDHLRKDTVINKYFAHYLQELSGVKAISIRQTLFYNHFFPQLNANCFFEITRKSNNEFPFFVENISKKKVDYDIIIPNTSLQILDTLTHVYLKENLNTKIFNHILIFDKVEFDVNYSDAIPLINISEKEFSENLNLVKLPKGNYAVILLDKDFKLLDRINLTVK